MREPSRATTAPKHVILFLAANPADTHRLALDREARAIHLELKRSGHRDRFDFQTRWAAEPLDLLREMRELRPTVVHFSGHGGGGTNGVEPPAHHRDAVVDDAASGRDPSGVFFDSPTGAAQRVAADAIAQTLEAAGPSVRLVVLNACFTEAMADALLAHVDCVVGMTGSIHDDAARSFAVGFYGGLGEHESVAAAFKQGRAAINLEGLLDADRPQLKVRTGFDARQLILATAPPRLRADLPCPYPGMRPYTADEAAAFHGREADIDEIIGRLRAGEREIYVIGPSGSGKSSLVAAGVLPRIARGAAGLDACVVRTMRPGEQPAKRLFEALDLSRGQPFVAADCIAALLVHRSHDVWVLLVIDQLEELFTQANGDERDAFLAALRALRAERRVFVIVTLRADFFGALMESPLWPERGRDKLSRIEVGPLRGEALRDAIAAPAHDAGVLVEPDLIERLLADTASEPGILPLLQETMVQLWDKRTDQTLTLADYQALGDRDRHGIAVAVARRADATQRGFTDAMSEIARRVLLRLISFGEGRSDTRRQQTLTQLRTAGDNDADFDTVLQTMVNNRLLTVDEDGHGEPLVDLAHEVLIAAWPTLVNWIRSHRVDEQKRRQLEVVARRWAEHGRGIRGLLDSIELAEAEAWQRTESARQLGHGAEVIALIAASRAEHARRENDAREQAEKLAASERASRQLLARMYAESGRQLVVDGHIQEAVPYLIAARKNGIDEPPLRMLFSRAKHHLPLIPALAHQDIVTKASFSPLGTCFATASRDGIARLWDAATGKLLLRLEHQHAVMSVAFSPDGNRIATSSWDKTARVWDARTGRPLVGPLVHHLHVVSAIFSPDATRIVTASWDKTAQLWDAATGKPVTKPLEHKATVYSAIFSADGTRVVTASADSTARVWSAITGKPITDPLQHKRSIVSASFSPDGARIVTASWDSTARIWDARSARLLTAPIEHEATVRSAVFSFDGARIVTSSDDKTARVWDAITAKPLTGPLAHQDAVLVAAFSNDGAHVVTASKDKTARVWDVANGKPVTVPLEHQGRVVDASFDADGARVVTASLDKTARVWSATNGGALSCSLEHQLDVQCGAFSPDGSRVVTTSKDKTARVWNAMTGKLITAPLEHRLAVTSGAFSADGMSLVTACLDGTAQIWNTATGKHIAPFLTHGRLVTRVTFSPDGSRIVTASMDGAVRLWDAATGKLLHEPLRHAKSVRNALFSADGGYVVTVSGTFAQVWDVATGKPIASPLEHSSDVNSAVFSPDSMRVVTSCDDHTARVWETVTSKALARPFEHQDEVNSATFSSDGTRVVTASRDQTARVWDACTGKPLTGALEHADVVTSAEFSPDGTRVVTASRDRTARVWDATTGKPLTGALEHADVVHHATFSPDGTRVLTISKDKTARLWDLRPDAGSIEDWSLTAERSPFVLNGSTHARRSDISENRLSNRVPFIARNVSYSFSIINMSQVKVEF